MVLILVLVLVGIAGALPQHMLRHKLILYTNN